MKDVIGLTENALPDKRNHYVIKQLFVVVSADFLQCYLGRSWSWDKRFIMPYYIAPKTLRLQLKDHPIINLFIKLFVVGLQFYNITKGKRLIIFKHFILRRFREKDNLTQLFVVVSAVINKGLSLKKAH